MIKEPCPTCGRELQGGEWIKVDLNRNIIIVDGEIFKVRPRQAEIMSVLVEKCPQVALKTTLGRRVFGYEGCTDNCLSTYISLLRHSLRGTNVKIYNVHGRGWCIERDGSPTTTIHNDITSMSRC